MSTEFDREYALSQEIKQRMKELRAKERAIDDKARIEKIPIHNEITQLTKKCPHLSKSGDAYDDWCDFCGLKL